MSEREEQIREQLAAASEAEDRRLEDLAIEIVELREQLAAADEKWRKRFEQFGKIVMKEKETALAAEREKVKLLVKALEAIHNHASGHNRNHCLGCSFSFNTASSALAKVKEGK